MNEIVWQNYPRSSFSVPRSSVSKEGISTAFDEHFSLKVLAVLYILHLLVPEYSLNRHVTVRLRFQHQLNFRCNSKISHAMRNGMTTRSTETKKGDLNVLNSLCGIHQLPLPSSMPRWRPVKFVFWRVLLIKNLFLRKGQSWNLEITRRTECRPSTTATYQL